MKSDLRLLGLATVAIVLFSCKTGKNQDQIQTFDENVWNRFKILSFDIPVNNLKSTYTIQSFIRFTDEFPHNSIPVHIIMTSPEGEERIWEQTLLLRDSEGNWAGFDKGKYREVSIPFRTKHKFSEPGVYHITIEQIIPKYDTPGVMAFGLRLEKE